MPQLSVFGRVSTARNPNTNHFTECTGCLPCERCTNAFYVMPGISAFYAAPAKLSQQDEKESQYQKVLN